MQDFLINQIQFENKKIAILFQLLPTLIHPYHMYHRELLPFVRSIDVLFSLILKPTFYLVIIIFLSSEDHFVFLRAGILQVSSKEMQLRNKNLENDVSPFSESAFSAEKWAILCLDDLR